MPGSWHNQLTQVEPSLARAKVSAHLDAKRVAEFPTTVTLMGVVLPLYQWSELSSLAKKTIQKRAMDLRDLIEMSGTSFFRQRQDLALNRNAGAEALANWIIEVQVTIANAVPEDSFHGYIRTGPFERSDFGAPSLEKEAPRDVCQLARTGYVTPQTMPRAVDHVMPTYEGFGLAPPNTAAPHYHNQQAQYHNQQGQYRNQQAQYHNHQPQMYHQAQYQQMRPY